MPEKRGLYFSIVVRRTTVPGVYIAQTPDAFIPIDAEGSVFDFVDALVTGASENIAHHVLEIMRLVDVHLPYAVVDLWPKAIINPVAKIGVVGCRSPRVIGNDARSEMVALDQIHHRMRRVLGERRLRPFRIAVNDVRDKVVGDDVAGRSALQCERNVEGVKDIVLDQTRSGHVTEKYAIASIRTVAITPYRPFAKLKEALANLASVIVRHPNVPSMTPVEVHVLEPTVGGPMHFHRVSRGREVRNGGILDSR